MLRRPNSGRGLRRLSVSRSPRILFVALAITGAFALMVMSSGRSGATDMAGASPPEQPHDSVRLALPSIDDLDLGFESISLG